ncbi:MAG: hydroxymethylbilane synthase [Rickettsiaceae bacterium]
MQIRIGTRKSKLALIQTNLVIAAIHHHHPEITCQIVPIITTGDKITDINLYDIGGKALFLKEIEEQLLLKNIDLAVHSLKDIPGIMPDGLEITAVLERSDPRDCFVSNKYTSIQDLPLNARVGSSSVRRKVIINQIRPDINVVQFRGNVNTRLQKLHNNEVDAAILACSGLHRANLFNPAYCFPIDTGDMLPAAGQGIIAIEARSDHHKLQEICSRINHPITWRNAKIERDFLAYLDASCRTPIAAYAQIDNQQIKANYMLSNITGSQIESLECIVSPDNIETIGAVAAKQLKKYFVNYNQDVLGL